MQKRLDQQDRQLSVIFKAEADYNNEPDALIKFWENIWSKGGLKFPGVKWTFRLADLYYKQKRYDDAWRFLNELVLLKPDYITNTRKWQIKVLKKEKKDYSHIQDLLDQNL